MSRSRLKRELDRGAKAPSKTASDRLTIEAIKEQVSIEDLVEHLGGSIPRLGSNWSKASCPFHEDRTPSASINPVEGYFHCFSCETRGDVVDLAQKHLNLPPDAIKEALAWLAKTF